MKIISKPIAKSMFFSKIPIIISIPKLDFHKEVKLNRVRVEKSKTQQFDAVVKWIISLAKEENPMINISTGDVKYGAKEID